MTLSTEMFNKLTDIQKSEYLRGMRKVRAMEDLIYLTRDVLRYREIEQGVHGVMADALKLPDKKKLLLMPRGSFKTTVVTIGGVIQDIINNGNIRILLDSEVLGYSEKLLGQVKRDLGKEGFVDLFGDLISQDRKETASEFTVTTRKDMGLKEPTVSVGGIGTVQNGPHYDKIYADDLHSEKNISTKEQIEKVIAHYRLLLSLLDPGGELIIVGTRWHFRDLYSYILEEEVPRPNSGWAVVKEKAIRDDGSLFFPNRLSKEFLDQQRMAQGSYLFSVLYQNEPVSSDDAAFKKEDFRYWEGIDFPLQDGKRIAMNIYILHDRAFSTKESADYTGSVCVGVSSSGNIYVLEAERNKFGLQEMFDLTFKWCEKFGWDRVKKVGIETINWEEVEIFFRQAMAKKNKFFICERLLPDRGKSKELRIQTALEARYRNHTVFHKKGMYDLEDELMRFPVSTHDDLCDSLAYIVPFMTVPGNPGYERDDFEYESSGLFGNTGY